MKKPILVALIAATALMPIAASAQEWQGRRGRGAQSESGDRAERPVFNRPDAGQRPEWGQRPEGGQRYQRPLYTPSREAARPTPPAAPPQPAAPSGQRFDGGDQNGRRGGWRGERNRDDGQARPTQPQQAAPDGRGGDNRRNGAARDWNARPDANAHRDWDRRDDNARRGRDNRSNGAQRDFDRRDDWGRGDAGNRGSRWGGSDYGRGDWSRGNNWNRDWRRDNRYDWQGWRSRNRNLYRLPRYYPPQGYGYGYQRFGIGAALGAILFSQDYWIDDPWSYRLPPADGPYRWVRYYNDALLVDVRDGEVVDVIHDIFW